MTLLRLKFAAVLVVVTTLSLTGCGVVEAATVDTTTYIGGEIDPAGTVWFGTDSGGDDTTFTLHEDGTVGVTYGESSYDDPNDTWRVADGVLHIDVFLDDMNGVAEYVGSWNPDTSTIDAEMVTTESERRLTVTLVQK